MLTAFLAITCVVLIIALGVSAYLNYKLGKIILRLEDVIEESLDEIDQIYASISKILEIPVFFDSIEVRQVISDIDNARQIILKIASSISSVTKDEDDTQEKDE